MCIKLLSFCVTDALQNYKLHLRFRPELVYKPWWYYGKLKSVTKSIRFALRIWTRWKVNVVISNTFTQMQRGSVVPLKAVCYGFIIKEIILRTHLCILAALINTYLYWVVLWIHATLISIFYPYSVQEISSVHTECQRSTNWSRQGFRRVHLTNNMTSDHWVEGIFDFSSYQTFESAF